MPPTIGLAMLIRDEEATIERALLQALPVVDHVTLLDTGSEDDTLHVAREILGAADVDWNIGEREWDGFGPSRTALLELDRHSSPCDYTLMLDADHVLHVDGEAPALTADAYLIPVKGAGDSWRLPLVTRRTHPFEYRGVAHSYLTSREPDCSRENLDWLSIDGGPGASREKLERDRVLLERAHAEDPSDGRTVFYLAQTYRDLDLHDQAAATYLQRAEMGGFAEEVYWSLFQAGCLTVENVSFSAGADLLLKAWRFRPSRVEALRALAHSAGSVADKYPLPDDILFVTKSSYRVDG